MDFRIEVLTLPVADVDRAKNSYKALGASVVMCGNSKASGAYGALMKRGVPSRLTLPVSQWRNALWKQTITSRA